MTLIFAHASADIGFIVADTLLTPPFELKGHVGPVNGKFHGLKIQVLNDKTAVAFASSDNVAAALDLVRGLNERLSQEPAIDPADYLFQSYANVIANEEPPADCAFLVLQLAGDEKRLSKITAKGISNCTRTYIGDSAEYKRLMDDFRRKYEPPKTCDVQLPDGTFRQEPLVVSEGEVEFCEISAAMKGLVEKRDSNTVGAIGDFVIRVVDAKVSGNLEYLQERGAWTAPWEGAGTYALLASNIGTRGVGVHYQSGNIGLGYILFAGDSEYCRKVNNVNESQFIEHARATFGLSLT